MNIITNNHIRHLIALGDITSWGGEEADRAADQFDYLAGTEDEWTPRLVEYRGGYIDVLETLAAPDHLKPWHSIAPDSFFSGVLVRWVDNESVVVGRYYS
jgi:hypothetical protein